MVSLATTPGRCQSAAGVVALPKANGLFPSGKEQSGLPLGNNVFAVGVAERAEGFKMNWRIDRAE